MFSLHQNECLWLRFYFSKNDSGATIDEISEVGCLDGNTLSS